jgi:hypothetical protein
LNNLQQSTTNNNTSSTLLASHQYLENQKKRPKIMHEDQIESDTIEEEEVKPSSSINTQTVLPPEI